MLIDTAIIRYIPDILFQINPATHLFHDHTIDDIYTPFSHQLKGILPLSSGYMIGKIERKTNMNQQNVPEIEIVTSRPFVGPFLY